MKQKGDLIRFIQKRVEELSELAIKEYDKNPSLSRRYIKIALEYKNKNKVKLPKEVKYGFCKKCFTPWIPGKTVRIRIIPNRYIIYTCLKCGYKKRLPFKRGHAKL